MEIGLFFPLHLPLSRIPTDTPRDSISQRRNHRVAHLTIEGMGFQKLRDQTQFQVCSHHVETGEELCKKAVVPALELRGPEWIH